MKYASLIVAALAACWMGTSTAGAEAVPSSQPTHVNWSARDTRGEEVRHAARPFVAARQRGHEIARGHDGVRGERVPFDPASGRQHPGQRLLDQVVDQVRVADPSRHDAADQRDELQDRLLTQLVGRANTAHRGSLR